jgi:hypothetical protein
VIVLETDVGALYNALPAWDTTTVNVPGANNVTNPDDAFTVATFELGSVREYVIVPLLALDAAR